MPASFENANPPVPLSYSVQTNEAGMVLTNVDSAQIFRLSTDASKHGVMALKNASGTTKIYLVPAWKSYMERSLHVGNTSAADDDAILELTSTSQGFLVPRMTTAERNAITTPPTGLMIYDTTQNQMQYYYAGWRAM